MTMSCDWCGNHGHQPVDHPLPPEHEHYDPALDDPDNVVMQLALASYLDFEERRQREGVMAPLPLDVILGRDGQPVTCNAVMHWFRTDAPPGATCLCGEKVED